MSAFKQVSRANKRKRGDDAEQAESKAGEFRQKVLILSSRGVTFRMRHLMNDLVSLLPHVKKDAKLDDKHQLYMVNELADLASCNNAILFEARRHQELYLWAAKTPNGPSVRFHVLNSHTMDELKMTGNCLKGSRPIICFDKSFDSESHLRLIKELLTHIFAVPATARKAKPFVDHIAIFSAVDGKVWFRNFQIVENARDDAEEIVQAIVNSKDKSLPISLSEIGPRFVLEPVKILEGSFCGSVLYDNKGFRAPSEAGLAAKMVRAGKYRQRKEGQAARKEKISKLGERKEPNPFAGVFA